MNMSNTESLESLRWMMSRELNDFDGKFLESWQFLIKTKIHTSGAFYR